MPASAAELRKGLRADVLRPQLLLLRLLLLLHGHNLRLGSLGLLPGRGDAAAGALRALRLSGHQPLLLLLP
jgi:hypothetical protein